MQRKETKKWTRAEEVTLDKIGRKYNHQHTMVMSTFQDKLK